MREDFGPAFRATISQDELCVRGRRHATRDRTATWASQQRCDSLDRHSPSRVDRRQQPAIMAAVRAYSSKLRSCDGTARTPIALKRSSGTLYLSARFQCRLRSMPFSKSRCQCYRRATTLGGATVCARTINRSSQTYYDLKCRGSTI